MIEIESIHEKFVSILFERGERFPKKHGEWIYKKLYDSLFIEMDSWNKHIKIKRGSGEYSYWVGFTGERVDFCGGNFGGFTQPDIDVSMLKYWLANASVNFGTRK